MIHSGMKKVAAGMGLQEKNGVAFGSVQGYMITLREAAGYKIVGISARTADENAAQALREFLLGGAFRKQYRVQNAAVTGWRTDVFFQNVASNQRLPEAVNAILAKMQELGAVPADCCPVCGQPFAEDDTRMLLDGCVMRVHAGCAVQLEQQHHAHREEVKASGSVAEGAVGAVLGGIVGAIPWAVAFFFGWFVGWLGFLIGAAAQKGYDLCKGKQTRAKAVVVAVAVLVCVVAAEYGAYIAALWHQCQTDPELAEYSFRFRDMFPLLHSVLANDSATRLNMIRDVVLGWLFAGLGIFRSIQNIFANTADRAPVRMDG